jgi:hypothetical protein
MRSLRRLLRALPVVAAALFGLQQIGVNPVAPGLDLDFAWRNRSVQGQPSLALSSDSGNQNCWIRLRLRCEDATGLTAQLSDGTPLTTSSRRSSDGKAWDVEISKAGAPRHAKFEWPSGTEIYLMHPRSLPGAVVEDWEIYTASGKRDSRGRENWRRAWFVISLFLLGGIVAGAFLKEDAPPRPAPTPELFLAMAIEGMEGSSAEETKKLQWLLKEIVLEGARAEDALATIAGGKRTLWFKARRQFLNRLDHLIETIQFYRRRLG